MKGLSSEFDDMVGSCVNHLFIRTREKDNSRMWSSPQEWRLRRPWDTTVREHVCFPVGHQKGLKELLKHYGHIVALTVLLWRKLTFLFKEVQPLDSSAPVKFGSANLRGMAGRPSWSSPHCFGVPLQALAGNVRLVQLTPPGAGEPSGKGAIPYQDQNFKRSECFENFLYGLVEQEQCDILSLFVTRLGMAGEDPSASVQGWGPRRGTSTFSRSPGPSALAIAVHSRSRRGVKLLLRNARVSGLLLEPARVAARQGSADLLQDILTTKGVLDSKDDSLELLQLFHYQLFIEALSSGDHKETVELLVRTKGGVDVGFSPDPSSGLPPPPLVKACEGGRFESAKALLAGGADVSAHTPLIKAIFSGHSKLARFLISQGADVNGQDPRGWTPLHQAAAVGNYDMCELLIGEGADVNAVESACFLTPKGAANGNGHRKVGELLAVYGGC